MSVLQGRRSFSFIVSVRTLILANSPFPSLPEEGPGSLRPAISVTGGKLDSIDPSKIEFKRGPDAVRG